MGKLFKIGSEKADAKKRGTPADWHVKIKLGHYDQKRARLCTDASLSESWAILLQAAVDRKNAGEPPDPDAMKKLPRRLLESFGLVSDLSVKRKGTFEDNVQDYVAELRTSGRTKMYVDNVERSLDAMGESCKWTRLADVNRDSFAEYLAHRKQTGTAPRTLNNDLATIRTFLAWCVKTCRFDSNPFLSVPSIDTSGAKKRKRRALNRDEVAHLLVVSGPRELFYRMALGTGLRKLELKSLQWRDCRLDDDRPCLLLRTEATKSRRADTLPLPMGLALRLREARPLTCLPTAPVFQTVPVFDTWLADLKRAGIKYRADDGTILGMHSLRVTFISELQRAGLSPQTVMQLARHTDYRLTCDSYTDIRFLDVFGAVHRLPTYENQAAEALRTGTNDLPISQDQIQDQMARPASQSDAIQCSDADNDDQSDSEDSVAAIDGFPLKNCDFSKENESGDLVAVGSEETPRLGFEPRT